MLVGVRTNHDAKKYNPSIAKVQSDLPFYNRLIRADIKINRGGCAGFRVLVRDRRGFCLRYVLFFDGLVSVTGPELKQLREDLGDAIGRSLSAAEMAKLCGLAPGNGADTMRKWEVTGPSGSAAELLRILAMASDRHPILENFNVFDRFHIDEKERPAHREALREKMRDEVRRRLG